MTTPVSTYNTLQLPAPHSWEQKVMMNAFLTPGLVELWCACGTKFGKSLGASGGLVGAAWVKKSVQFRWVAPIYSQAKIGLKYHKFLLPTPSYEVNKSEPTLTFKHNNTVIEYKSGKHPEDLEGEGITGGYGLDEAAKMQRQVYDSAKTTVTVTRAPIVGFSTPKGKGWFYDKCMEAKAEMEWARAKGIPPTKIFLTAPSSANPAVTKEAIEEARRALPDRLFRQYYLAEFLDDGSVFLNFRNCIEGPVLDFNAAIHLWIDKENKDQPVVIGADWAKKDDYCVFIALTLNTIKPKMVGYCRFNGVSYIEAVKHLDRFAKNFKQVSILRHDKTGVGEAIEDILATTHLPYEGVTFTNSSKTSMVNSLMLTFERGDITLANIPDLIYELDIYEVVTNSLGTMRYAAALGHHDDIVSALMLANSAVQEMRGGFEIRYLEDLPKTKLTIDRYYDELIQEIEDEG